MSQMMEEGKRGGDPAGGKIKRTPLCFPLLVSGERILIPILNIALKHS